MNQRMSLALILFVLPSVSLGCFIPLERGHSKVVVEGQLIGVVTAGAEEKQISLYFCNTKPTRVITVNSGGRFSAEFGYSYGGVYMLFPPLAIFPNGPHRHRIFAYRFRLRLESTI